MARLFFLLCLSNVAMTLAWFAHLRHPQWPLWLAVLVSWGIALVEYAIAIPAVRAAHAAGITVSAVKVAQEAVTLGVFVLVIGLVVQQTGLTWRFAVAGALLVAAVAVAFWPAGAAR